MGMRTLLLTALVLALAVGFTYWWFFIKPGQNALTATPGAAASNGDVTPVSPPATQPADASPAVVAPVSAASDSADAAKVAQPTESVVQPAAEARPAVQPTPSSKPAVPAGSGSLRFVFGGESWVEVVEGSGRTIISRKYQAGEVEQVVGKLPLSVVIGNAQSTRLAFNDVNFDLTPHTKVSVARFTLK